MLGADGDADVVEVAGRRCRSPSIRALTAGNAFRASIAALTKNDMKPRPTPCFFLNVSLYLARRSMTARHVGLVERRQDRGGLLRLDQALGDPLADRAHRACGSRGAAGGRRRGAGGAGAAAGGGRRRRLAAGVARCASTSSLVMPSAAAGPGDLRRVDALLGDEPADGGRERHRRRRRSVAAAGRAGAGGRRLSGGAGRLRRRRRPASGGRAAEAVRRVDRADDRADRRPSRLPATLILQDARRPGRARRCVALSVSSSNERLVRLDGGAVGLQPARSDRPR